MTIQELYIALEQSEPAPSFTPHQLALWLIHHNDWNAAHDLVQAKEDSKSSLIHGYLHDLEGDHWNAIYWYRRSGFPVPEENKWQYIIEQITASSQSDRE